MTRTTGILAVLLTIAAIGIAQADTPPAASKPAGDDGSLRYEVTLVEGGVRYGNADKCDPLKSEGWTKAKKGDQLGAGLIIHVPLRSKIKLVARPETPPTVILIESSSLITISDLHLKNNVATSRIKLGYGAIRAGVAEGGTRSDMEIESPVATLSKRGTDIFRFEYHDGRYMMSLSDQGRGMLQAIQNQMGAFQGGQFSRYVTAGQFVTQRMLRAIDNLKFDRNIGMNDQFGLTGNDQLFTLLNDHGLGFLLPPGNRPVNAIDGPQEKEPSTGPDQNTVNSLVSPINKQPPFVLGGNFGIGQGNLPGIGGSRLQSGQVQRVNPTLNRTPRNLAGIKR